MHEYLVRPYIMQYTQNIRIRTHYANKVVHYLFQWAQREAYDTFLALASSSLMAMSGCLNPL